MNPLLEVLRVNGAAWVRSQRDALRGRALPLPRSIRPKLDRYFAEPVLEAVRVSETPEIANPTFYAQLGWIPLDFRDMEGISFDNVILLKSVPRTEPQLASLLFHELVHVVQYSILGIDAFMDAYVLGWAAAGCDYFRIPLEMNAYELQGRFGRGEALFSVEAGVKEYLQAHAQIPASQER